jgi:hypothetical protein
VELFVVGLSDETFKQWVSGAEKKTHGYQDISIEAILE